MKKQLTILSTLLGTVVGASVAGFVQQKTINEKGKKVDKFKTYYNMLNQWLILKQENKSLEKYFIDNGYHTIAIYGIGEVGNRLYDELKNTDIKVEYAIDKEAFSAYSGIEVFQIDDELPKVDAIVVTAVFAFEEIEENLKKNVDCPIISLEDAIYEV